MGTDIDRFTSVKHTIIYFFIYFKKQNKGMGFTRRKIFLLDFSLQMYF